MWPTLHLAVVGLLGAGDHLEQRGLAGAVGTDDADDGAGRDDEVEVVDQQAVAEALGDVLELDHVVAQALARRDEDFVGFVAALVFDRLQVFEARQARLALAAAALGVLARPLQLLLRSPSGGPFPATLPASGARPSGSASRCSCPSTECRGRGRVRGSTRRRCRGSSGHG